MLIVEPDFARRIDLPGAGPCPRPVDIDRAGAGFCDLVALRVYTFAQSVTIDGEAEDDEVFIVAMRGTIDIAITQPDRASVAFALGGDSALRAVYMPPNAAYRLTAGSDCDIAYARARPEATGHPGVRGFAAAGSRLDVTGHAQGMDLALIGVRSGEAIALGANERFVHVRAEGSISATLGGASLGDWSTAALGANDVLDLTVESGAGEILLIAAATRGNRAKRGADEIE